ncbi:hypothetical protein K466DRAFT_645264 [Polyporus arcularius HHB13444]|uniref:DUF6593 domain-containing protein n=1 Tax=Polyporus arcularius HHB13444 TaxID=1314778 RepID=A0A5C3PRT1_9APHY|nr:hypothetical protein K466DRAFT_645264 [Polyporus arcularius HHB13444]
MSTPIAAVLTLTPDNPCNATVCDVDGKALYTVYTEHGKATVTYVANADEEVLASLEWHDTRPDRVTLGKGSPMSLRDWMHFSPIPFKDDVTFKDGSGRKYKWRGNSPGRALELFAEDDGFKEPISRFFKSRKDHKTGKLESAQLAFTARALEIRDTVIMSFLFLEKGRRVNENTSQNVGDVLGAPPLGAVMGVNSRLHNGGV